MKRAITDNLIKTTTLLKRALSLAPIDNTAANEKIIKTAGKLTIPP